MSTSTPPTPPGPVSAPPSAATAILRAIEPHPDAVAEAMRVHLAAQLVGLDAVAHDRACAQTLAGVALLLGMSRDAFCALMGRWHDHVHQQAAGATDAGAFGDGPIVGALTRDPAPPSRGD